MRRRVDAAALVTGLLAVLLAVVALWAAFGPVPWAALGAFLAGCGALTAGGTEPAQERDHRVRITGRV